MFKMLVSKAYMKSVTECVDCPKGSELNLPEDISKAWVKHGFCEPVKKSQPKIEKKIIVPVKEVKEAPQPKTRKKRSK